MAREEHATAEAARGQDVHESGRGVRRFRRFLALSMMLPALVAVGTTSAQATHVESFEIDGNRPVDTAGNLDWENVAGTVTTDATGADDESNYTGGSKEFDDPSTWSRGAGLPPKSDISEVYTYTTTDHDGHLQAYFGFLRVAGEGTVNYDVEFNQLPNISGDPDYPDRTVGDLLVRFEEDGNKGLVLTLAYKWTLAEDFYEGCILVPGYTPAAGWCPISTTDAGFVGATGEDGLFAEGTLDLTALFGADLCRPGYGTLNIRSIPGESLNSELKDYVAVDADIPPGCWKDISIANVAAATYDVAYDYSVVKSVADDRKTVESGANATFTYRVLLTAGDRQTSGNQLSGTVTLTNPNSSPMVADLGVVAATGACTFPGVPDVSTDPGLQVAVPAGDSSFVYTCTAPATTTDGSTTATVTWDEETYPAGTEGSGTYTDSAVASYTFALDQSTDEQTVVTDTFHTGGPDVLGTFSWADVYNETDASTPPHTVVVATYTRTIAAGAPGTCASYVNTARQTENDTGQSTTDQETVTVCAAALEVLGVQGSVGGALKGTCQGTLKARMRNGFEDSVRFTLRIGDRKKHYMVKGDSTRRVQTTAPARARVVLKARGKVIDRMRMPARCNPPEVLPATGLRATTSG